MGQTLTSEQSSSIVAILKERFNSFMFRHTELNWDLIEAKLLVNEQKLWSLYHMEHTGGEPDVVDYDEQTGEYIFIDCSNETPQGRRSYCYDREALDKRKQNKPANSAIDVANELGIKILDENEYIRYQKCGPFDQKSSSWLTTPSEVRSLGGALFGDYRYGRVFIYHNGADSYYAARGFRGILKV